MKKVLLFIVLFVLTSSFNFSSTDSMAYDNVSLYLNGNPIYSDVPACIINDRAMIPARSVLESVGAVVSWDEATRTMAASKNDVIVWIAEGIGAMSVKKGNSTYIVNFDVAPCILYNRTYIPVKAVLEVFGYSVSWNHSSRSVYIFQNAVGNVYQNESIDIYGFVPPVQTNLGSSYTIAGTVSSNALLNRLNVKITDVASGQVQINETQFDIHATSYSLLNIDSRVKFGLLSAGTKLLEITAVTNNETRSKFTYYFEVVKPVFVQPVGGTPATGGATMLWPVPSSGFITTIFWCDNPNCHSNAGRVNGHAAIDIAASENAPVIAVKDGTVIKTGFGTNENGFNGFGNFILVDHGNGLTTQYSHLYSIYVSEGDWVSAGQTIGGVGNTGNSTGNHLDFHIEQNGQRCDPLYYIEMHPNVQCHEPCDKPYFEQALRSRGLR